MQTLRQRQARELRIERTQRLVARNAAAGILAKELETTLRPLRHVIDKAVREFRIPPLMIGNVDWNRMPR